MEEKRGGCRDTRPLIPPSEGERKQASGEEGEGGKGKGRKRRRHEREDSPFFLSACTTSPKGREKKKREGEEKKEKGQQQEEGKERDLSSLSPQNHKTSIEGEIHVWKKEVGGGEGEGSDGQPPSATSFFTSLIGGKCLDKERKKGGRGPVVRSNSPIVRRRPR